MNARERIMAVLHHEKPDIIPFTLLDDFVIKDMNFGSRLKRFVFSEMWQNLLDLGLGLNCEIWNPVHEVVSPHVKMEVTHDYGNVTSWLPMDVGERKPRVIRTTLNTPVGSVSLTTRPMRTLLPWFTSGGHMIKNLSDYETVKFMIEDTEYSPSYEEIRTTQMMVANLGVVPAGVPESPLQAMIIELMGYRRFSLDYYMHREEFDELYRLIYKKELEIYKIAAESPAEIIWSPENMNGVVTTPDMFKKYCIPFYNEAANILHKHGKIYSVHMDGKLDSLRDLIPKTNIDVIEGFTPPPVGDLPLREAREAWKEKIIWANFPETVSLYGQEAVEKKTIEILKSVSPGDNFLLGITEDFPSPNHTLESVTTILKTVMKHGIYPIPKD